MEAAVPVQADTSAKTDADASAKINSDAKGDAGEGGMVVTESRANVVIASN